MTDELEPNQESEDEDDAEVVQWPVRGPATPGQAIVAIAFVFILGVALGFALCKAF